ncbi:MAG: AAA family ATPase [Candidatus Marinimicrobia bacterium]|nr:AAA family ATPase [Candidatus Neomarinimicrobiota bacterium]
MPLFGKRGDDDKQDPSENNNKEINLRVAEALKRDMGKGIVRFDKKYQKQLGVEPGDIVELEGERKTAAIVENAHPDDRGLGIIRMDGYIRRNAGVSIGDYVTVKKAEVQEAKRVVLAPAQRGVYLDMPGDLVKGNLFGRPVVKGDLIVASGGKLEFHTGSSFDKLFRGLSESLPLGFSELKFIVVNTTPKGIVQITHNTEIEVLPQAVDVARILNETNYAEFQEYVDLFLRLYLGVIPPGLKVAGIGILIYSELGSENEKFFLDKILDSRRDRVHYINAREVVGHTLEEALTLLENTFKTALQNAPAIIVIDSIHLLAPRRDTAGEFEKRILYKLLALLGEVRGAGEVVVLSTTDNIELIDQEVLRTFDETIKLPSLSTDDRYEVLLMYTQHVPLEVDVDVNDISNNTEGYTVKDLRRLVAKAIINAAKRMGPQEIQHRHNVLVTMKDFKKAMKEIDNAKEDKK